MPGQRINISLYDFGLWQRRSRHSDGSQYPDYGQDTPLNCQYQLRFVEELDESLVHLCGSDSRSRHVFLSEGHFVEVYLDTENPRVEPSGFLIQHQGMYSVTMVSLLYMSYR